MSQHKLHYKDRAGTEHTFDVPRWKRITEDHYHQMLECLWPAQWDHPAFLVGEAYDSCPVTGANRYTMCLQTDKEWLEAERPVSVAEYRAVITFRPAIRYVEETE
jgi:hypothetical protein